MYTRIKSFFFQCSFLEGVKISGLGIGENISANQIPNYLLRLSSPIKIFNYLPVTLLLHHKAFPQPLTLDPGGTTSIIRMDPHVDEELDIMVKIILYIYILFSYHNLIERLSIFLIKSILKVNTNFIIKVYSQTALYLNT